ncbi:hypothetical protein OC834_007671, partial [Tilletia horrida]
QQYFEQALRTLPEHGYQLREQLRHGAFGQVFEVTKRGFNTRHAVKIAITNGRYTNTNDLQNEIDLHQKAANSNIIELQESWTTPRCVVIVMELAAFGSLQDFVESRKAAG